jgi:regulator of sirC expression with transglutaminase-like and TPR domain
MAAFSFQEEIQLEPVNLPRAALCYAQEIAYPALEVDAYLGQIDRFAEAARGPVPSKAGTLIRAQGLAEYLFQELGFKGDVENYADPRNSYLNEVLERRKGIPITLSVIYLAIASRIDLPAQGVGLPGHFIVSVQGENDPFYLDPFHGGRRLTVIDCARLVELSTGYSGPFQPHWLRPASEKEILVRMLFNLRTIYIHQDKWRMALPVVEHLNLLQPEQPDHLRDLGTINRQNGRLRLALDYYAQYLRLAPHAPDADLVRRNYVETAEKLARRN